LTKSTKVGSGSRQTKLGQNKSAPKDNTAPKERNTERKARPLEGTRQNESDKENGTAFSNPALGAIPKAKGRKSNSSKPEICSRHFNPKKDLVEILLKLFFFLNDFVAK
jgi:hypothetical protein